MTVTFLITVKTNVIAITYGTTRKQNPPLS